MDMWKAFRNSTRHNAPQAAILFDKFHVLRHLSDALDKVRKSEYGRLSGKHRRFIKGQKYALLSHPQNLQGPARKNLKLLLHHHHDTATGDDGDERGGRGACLAGAAAETRPNRPLVPQLEPKANRGTFRIADQTGE
jgi:Transposase